jgi:CTP synthase (UTP-ammonia lyase)
MERHRHRYEVNPTLLQIEGSRLDASRERIEACETKKDKRRYFMVAQFHPEFTS